jgi:acetoin utilization deacetylase AcuC-like enzyme
MICACTLPTLFVLESGYAIGDIGINVVNVLTGCEETMHYLDTK